MFITVLHSDNKTSLFNIHCKTEALLECIKMKCGCECDADIDLADLNGQAMNLPAHRCEVALDILRQREAYILISVSWTSDQSNPVHTPLLHNCNLREPLCLDRLRAAQNLCTSAEANWLSRRPASTLSTPNQPRSSRRIRFSSGQTSSD